MPTIPSPDALLLAFDAASPTVSVAVGRSGEVLASATGEIRRSSGELLPMIDHVLREIGAAPGDLGGVLCLRGPGSFTGIRVGLATALGLRDALGIPAAAVPTLPVLAAAAFDEDPGAEAGIVLAAVDAIRGEWFVRTFSLPASGIPGALDEARRVPIAAVAAAASARGPARILGFGITAALAALGEGAGPGLASEPGPLAPVVIRLAGRLATEPENADQRETPAVATSFALEWDPDLLTRPLYLREPAVTPPAPRRMRSQEPRRRG